MNVPFATRAVLGLRWYRHCRCNEVRNPRLHGLYSLTAGYTLRLPLGPAAFPDEGGHRPRQCQGVPSGDGDAQGRWSLLPPVGVDDVALHGRRGWLRWSLRRIRRDHYPQGERCFPGLGLPVPDFIDRMYGYRGDQADGDEPVAPCEVPDQCEVGLGDHSRPRGLVRFHRFFTRRSVDDIPIARVRGHRTSSSSVNPQGRASTPGACSGMGSVAGVAMKMPVPGHSLVPLSPRQRGPDSRPSGSSFRRSPVSVRSAYAPGCCRPGIVTLGSLVPLPYESTGGML